MNNVIEKISSLQLYLNKQSFAKESAYLNNILIKLANEVYTVRYGDTLSEIAKDYGVTISELKAVNDGLTSYIFPGDKISIPSSGSSARTVHTAVHGESLWLIAEKYGIDFEALKGANPSLVDRLDPGDEVNIPLPSETTEGSLEGRPNTIDSGVIRTAGGKTFSDEAMNSLLWWEGDMKSKGDVPHGGRIHGTGYHEGTDHTVGYGHKLTNSEKRAAGLSSGGGKSGPLSDAPFATVYGVQITYHPLWSGVSKDESIQIMRGDLERFEAKANRFELTQYEFDALVHFIYNRGSVPSEVSEKLSNGDYELIHESSGEHHFARYRRAGNKRSEGLVNRRRDEVAMWDGEYPH
jgi:LysM repeat protein/GH24 family phage-related lysozyme (muramidase)